VQRRRQQPILVEMGKEPLSQVFFQAKLGQVAGPECVNGGWHNEQLDGAGREGRGALLERAGVRVTLRREVGRMHLTRAMARLAALLRFSKSSRSLRAAEPVAHGPRAFCFLQALLIAAAVGPLQVDDPVDVGTAVVRTWILPAGTLPATPPPWRYWLKRMRRPASGTRHTGVPSHPAGG